MNNYQETSEAGIINLARTGDPRAFEELVHRRQSIIRNLMRRLCNDVTLAEDLAQQVFLKVWQSIAQLSRVNAFDGWLKRIAINTWLQYLRKNDAMRNSLEFNDTVYVPPPGSNGSVAMDLDKALLVLPEQVRTCVVLAYHEGMSHPEISEAIELPLGTVKSHINRGAKKVTEMLAAYKQPTAGEKV